MAADETLRFNIEANDKGSDAFSRFGRSVSDVSAKMDAATARAIFLDDALKRQRATAKASADATLSLAKSDALLAEVEGRLRDGALEAEFALKKEAEAKKANADATRKATAENNSFASSLDKIAKGARDKGGPWWLGPALALAPAAGVAGGVGLGAAAGIGGAFAAGAVAAAAFGVVAKPVLAQALTAEQAVGKAQSAYNAAIDAGTKKATAYKSEQLAIAKAYAGMSPQQVALSRQLGDMSSGWTKLKQAQTPVVAGALQPWLKSVTDLTGRLAPVIRGVSPVIGDLGRDFDSLVNGKSFTKFDNFIAGTGSTVLQSAGYTAIDLVKAFITVLPEFTPLIDKASRGVAEFGPAVDRWASSRKTAGDITKFMGWFTANGPVVGGLLKNIGGALKAIAPGLGPAATSELGVMSSFFGYVARLPPAVAKPLAEVAGVLLTLNKLGVVPVGIKLLGLGGAGAGAGAGEAAAAGGAAGLWSKLLPGVRFAGGVLAASVIVDTVLKDTSSGSGKNWLDNPFGQGTFKNPETGKTAGTPTALTSWVTLGHDIEHIWGMTWNNTVGRTAKGVHDVSAYFDAVRHDGAQNFDGIRHDTASIWDTTWQNTAGRAGRGVHDVSAWVDTLRHDTAVNFDGTRRDAASAWDTVWNNTVARAERGVAETLKWIGTLPAGIGRLFAGAGSWLVGAGESLVSGLVSGIESAGGAVASALEGLIPGPVRGVLSKVLGWAGFASGTNWAPAGWAWVGERGPELMRFRGGEQVRSAASSAAAAPARGGGNVYNVTVNVNAPVGSHPQVIGREIAQYLSEFVKNGGRIYPYGIAPR